MSAFVPLRVRSHGSLLHGTAAPEALVQRARALGYDALALTDRDNLYLAVRFLQGARAEGLRALAGAEIAHPSGSALLLPLDRRGWAHLCELITRRQLDARFDLTAALAERHAGLHVIVESTGLAAGLLGAGVPAAAGDDERTPGARPGGLWLGVRGLPVERTRLAERAAGARRLGVPLVATGDVVMLDARDHETHRVAVTAAAGELIERMAPSAFARARGVARRARRVGAARARGVRRRRRARGRRAGAGEQRRASGALPARARDGHAHLPARPARRRRERRRATAPARARGRAPALGAVTSPGRWRASTTSWRMIERMGFTDYFLLVADIVGFARARGIPTVGRGSGASSIVAYALGITNVDPLRYGLYFERFLHPSRRDCPDLDIDLCWRRRDEVIEHVYRTYGADRVAMISTHSTLGARSAFRETAKALGVPSAARRRAGQARAASARGALPRPAARRRRRGGRGLARAGAGASAGAGREARRRATPPQHPLRRPGDRRPAADPLRAARARRQGASWSRSSRCAPSRRSGW